MTTETLTIQERKHLEHHFTIYANGINAQASFLYPYRPFSLASELYLEGYTLAQLQASIEAEGEDWQHTLNQLQPILPTLSRLRVYRQAGWLVSLNDD